jgi:16S rRNA (cytosine967-C5)-methyltransferase
LIKQNGETKTRQMIATINDAPSQSVRVNTAYWLVMMKVKAALEAENFTAIASKVAAHAFVVNGGHVASSKGLS